MVAIAPRTDKKICSAVGSFEGSEKFAVNVPNWPKTSASTLSRIAYPDEHIFIEGLEVVQSKSYIDLGMYENHVPDRYPGQVSPTWYIAAFPCH